MKTRIHDTPAPPLATLPEHLARWATTRPRAIAIRHKSLGVWEVWTWSDLQAEVGRVEAAIEAQGLEPGDAATFSSGLSPRALASALAAQARSGEAFFVSDGAGPLTQAGLIGAARSWLEANGVRAADRAFIGEAPTTEAAAIFIAGWLVAGITLILPEDPTTADADRGEAQPTIVAAIGATYERLQQRVADNLPAAGTRLRTAVDAALATSPGDRVRRALGGWLLRRPLRGILGFRRAALALVLDDAPPPAETRELFAQLGVPLRALAQGPRAEVAGRLT
jgi:long-subunit acyl-CoA synthetase (AMP-forming)